MRSRTLTEEKKMENDIKKFLDFLKNTNWYTKCYNWTEWYRLMLVCELAGVKWCDGDIPTSFIPSNAQLPLYLECTIDKGIRFRGEPSTYDVSTKSFKYIDIKEIIDNDRLKELL